VSHTLHLGDCLDVLRTMPDCSVDAVVTDPPYGLAFMGKRWDYDVPSVEVWAECLRVLKPGGHLLAFAGTRTQHRMACRIEDAGFEIRDMIAWVYGSGFPKSLDVSKAIDKAAGAEREVVGSYHGATNIGKASDGKRGYGCDGEFTGGTDTTVHITAPATPEAQQWAGWGTALKPSIETVTWARKPFPPEREQAKILGNLWKIEARLWLLSSASAAAQSSTSSQSEYGAACATAQWTVDDATNTRAALRGLMDTWQCEMATHMSLSIVSSWRRTLEESSKPGSTSTTETESRLITDWKTLNCCLSQITPESIIQACSLPGGFNANASTAAQIFNASLASLQSTLTLSAIEPATWRALDDSQGEAVRPNLDPVVMARKPLAGTVAANVLEHGTGALNVDGCRIEGKIGVNYRAPGKGDIGAGGIYEGGYLGEWNNANPHPESVRHNAAGRWPANLIHDGSDEVTGLFPGAGSYTGNPERKDGTVNHGSAFFGAGLTGTGSSVRDSSRGSAARFFYTAKASKEERQGVGHPTVKPLDLMAYLCRLVTPPGGIVLDPFMGSGTTIKAAVGEGFRAIGIERDPAYFAMAEHRMDGAQLGLSLPTP
jgi:DNA modification methylase